MGEKFLYSSIQPLLAEQGQMTIDDCFREEIKKSNHIEIAVGFSSFASLKELDRLIAEAKVKSVSLILGMYYFNGFPKILHELVLEINKKWQESGLGEIRLIRSFKYHGKLYCFLKNKSPFSAILGSANLSFLTSETTHLHQYEVALFTDNEETLKNSLEHINSLKAKEVSENIAVLEDLHLLFDNNPHLEGVQGVAKIDDKITNSLQSIKSKEILTAPLNAPSQQDIMASNSSDVSYSNVNDCYSKSKKLFKSKNWFDMFLTINEEIPAKKGYSAKGDWFYVITDDGYEFKAQITKGKQFCAVKNEQILGRWLKGRLVSLGLIKHIEDISKDEKKEGFITKEVLSEYGGNYLLLKNTKKIKKDEKGINRNVWFLSFPRNSI